MTTRPSRPNHICVARMLAAMQEGPQSAQELVEASGASLSTVKSYVLTFRKHGVARIGEWQLDRRGRLTVPAYALGAGNDAVRKVTPIDNAARMRRLRVRQSEHRALHGLAA